MRRLAAGALFFGAAPLAAQGIWDSSLRFAPSFYSYNIKGTSSEKISEFSVPFFFIMPVTSALSVDLGTAFASAKLDYTVTDASGNSQPASSQMSGLTDTQVRANYAIGEDFIVLTAGVNVPTGSSALDQSKIGAATRIGSDFLTFPISGFGSGLAFTGGAAIAKPAGEWNLGFGASYRHSSEFEPFVDPTTGAKLKFTPGPEYRVRMGADHPFGTGRVALGLIFSTFGNDNAVDAQSNPSTFNTGNRYIAQVAVNNSFGNGIDYSAVVWNLYRTSGTLINQSASPSGNITNALATLGFRGPNGIGIEPSLEARLWSQEGSSTSYLTTLATRFFINQGAWALVPGVGFSIGSMESAPLTGLRASLGIRLGGT